MRMKNHFNKMGKALLGAALLSTVGITSCSDDDFHLKDLEDNAPSFLGQSLYHELVRRGNYTNVVRLVDDLNYAEVLSKTGSKTMFVANDSAWAEFYRNNPWGVKSYEDLTYKQESVLLHNSMLNNAYVMEMLANTENGGKNLCLRQGTSASAVDSVPVWRPEALPKTQSPVDVDWYASLRNQGQDVYMALDATVPMMTHFLEGQMILKSITRSDVSKIIGQPWSADEGSRSYIYGARVVEADVVCLNGYMHVLDRVLIAPSNMAEVIRSNGKTNYFSAMLDRFSAPYYNAQLTEQYKALFDIPADSVYEKRYISNRSQGNSKITETPDKGKFVNPVYLPFDPGWNAYSVSSTTPKEEDMAAMFVPTDEAMVHYFTQGGGVDFIKRYGVLENTEENLLTNLYNIPIHLMGSLIQNLMKDSFNESVPSKYLTIVNDAQDQMFMQYNTEEEYKQHIDTCLLANNGVVYLVNSVDAPADFASVIAPALIAENTQVVRTVAQADDNFIQGNDYAQAPLKQYFSTYLKAMQSKFSFFVPIDEGLNSYGYVDPAGYAVLPYGKRDGTVKKRYYWRFEYDATVKDSKFPIKAVGYQYDEEKGQSIPEEIGGKGGDKTKSGATSASTTDALATGYGPAKRTLLVEMMDQHILVHDDDEGVRGQRSYYLSRNAAPVYIKKAGQWDANNRGTGMEIQGGFQLMLQSDDKPENDHYATVLEGFDKTQTSNGYGNGMTYIIDRPIQPTMRSVCNVLTYPAENNPFSSFYTLADPNGVTEGLLTSIGFMVGETKTERDLEKLKYHVFVRANDNPDSAPTTYCPASGESIVRFFSNYNYTIYVPNNEKVQEARDNGLMTWEEIEAWVESKTKLDEEGNPIGMEAEDTIKAQAMVTALVNFVKYHFQDHSLFVDNVSEAGDYQTSCVDNVTNSYLPIKVTQSPSALSLVDRFGKTINVVDDETKRNILARDINYNGQATAARYVKNSSFVVLHQVDNYLNFNAPEDYEGFVDESGNPMPVGRFDFWNYSVPEDTEALKAYVAKYRLR
jgi:uncharacterized surface protein with fasciclin (FAS1) repeats